MGSGLTGRLCALALGAALLLPGSTAWAQGNLQDMLGQAVRGLGTPSAPAPSPARPAPGGAPMGLVAGTALPPLAAVGSDAAAVVESVEGVPGLSVMDYVFPGQTIELGKKGKLVLSYLSGCLTETIQGGTARVGLDGAQVGAGGKRTASNAPGCEPAKPMVLAEASEAGAAVGRLGKNSPFGTDWAERAIKSGPPTFKWDAKLGGTELRILDLDQEPAALVWQGKANAGNSFIAYPAQGAPALKPGLPYRAELLRGGQVVGGALFSIDPGLDVPNTLANRVVPVAAR